MKKFLTLFALFCSSVMLITCDEEGGNMTVKGKLTNGKAPVQNAKIDIDGLVQFEAITDEDGYFAITNVSPGNHVLNIQKTLSNSAFSKTSESITVSSNLTMNNLVLPEPVEMKTPVVVQNLDANQVTLKWTSYTSDNFREYKVYQHTTPGLDETTGELIYVTVNNQDTTFQISIPHSSTLYFRVFVLSDNNTLAGSNLLKATTSSFENKTHVEVTELETDFYLNKGETQWISFNVEAGSLYNVAWIDAVLSNNRPYIGNYTAGSIYVGCYKSDKQTAYFADQRLIQMSGSPMPIMATETGVAYLKVYGFTNTVTGTFGVRITKLSPENFSELQAGGPEITALIQPGAMRGLYFQAESGGQYEVSAGSTVYGGAYGEGIMLQLSAFRQTPSVPLLYKKYFAAKTYDFDGSARYTFVAPATEKIFITVDGAYWWEANGARVSVKKLN